MKSYSDYRAEAWKMTRSGHWTMKYVAVWLVLMTTTAIINGLWEHAIEALDIQTWNNFLLAKAKAISSGLDLTVPSRTIALRMTEASAFELFFVCIVNGILCYALASLFLRAAKKESAWFAPSFGGFKYPLGVAWLYFRYVLQIALWSLLFLFPAFIAIYRYCQCWNLKVEHPDWSAGKCLAESARMMKGHKWERFSLDCSYWKPITLILLGVLAMTVLAVVDSNSLLSLPIAIPLLWCSLLLVPYLSIGQALFYLDLKPKDN